MFAAGLQIYFVHLSNLNKLHGESVSGILTQMQSSVRVFDKLSKLQLLPATFCFLEQLLELYGITSISHFDTVNLMLVEVLNLLFYLKVMLVKENAAEVSIEIVNV